MQRSLRDKNFPRLSNDDDAVYSCDNWISMEIDSKARICIEWRRIFFFLEMNCGITAFPSPGRVVTLIDLLISKQTLPWSQSGRLDTQYPNQDTVGDAATCSANFYFKGVADDDPSWMKWNYLERVSLETVCVDLLLISRRKAMTSRF